LLLLLTIGALPFSTALMAAYLKASRGQNLAAAVYAGSFLLMALGFFAMNQRILRAKAHLLQERLTPAVRRSLLRRKASGLLPYTVATLCALISPYLTLAICALVAAFYALPSTTRDTA